MSNTPEYYDRADTLCLAFMAMRPELTAKSFDEWLLAHDSKLTDHEKVAGWSILALHPDGASFDHVSVAADQF